MNTAKIFDILPKEERPLLERALSGSSELLIIRLNKTILDELKKKDYTIPRFDSNNERDLYDETHGKALGFPGDSRGFLEILMEKKIIDRDKLIDPDYYKSLDI